MKMALYVCLILMEHNYERNKSLIIVFDYTSFFPLFMDFFLLFGLIDSLFMDYGLLNFQLK